MKINNNKTRVHSLGKGAVTITGVSLYPGDRRLGPAPHILEKAQHAFDDIQRGLDAGQLMFDTDIGVLYGYLAVLRQLSTMETPHIANLRAQGKYLLRRAEALRA